MTATDQYVEKLCQEHRLGQDAQRAAAASAAGHDSGLTIPRSEVNALESIV